MKSQHLAQRLHDWVVHDPRLPQRGTGGLASIVFVEVVGREPSDSECSESIREFWYERSSNRRGSDCRIGKD